MSVTAISNSTFNIVGYSSKMNTKNELLLFDYNISNAQGLVEQKNDNTELKNLLAKMNKNGKYYPVSKFLGFTVREAYYIYEATGYETIGEIKQKFKLKDGAIKRGNPCIRDDGWTPSKNYEICIYEADINQSGK